MDRSVVVPFGSLYAYWNHSKALGAISDDKYPLFLIFVLWLFFSPGNFGIDMNQW